MRRPLLAAVVLAAIAAPGVARADRWTAGDTFVQAGVTLTLAADWATTRQICADVSPLTAWPKETNPVIGPECDRLSPDLYFPAAIALHAGIAYLLPETWMRRAWQGVTIGFQVRAIDRNLSAGYAIRW